MPLHRAQTDTWHCLVPWGKGGGNTVWFLSQLNCKQEMGHLQMETETFEALRGWPRESLGCSDPPWQFFLNLFWFGNRAENPELGPLFIQTDLLALLLI